MSTNYYLAYVISTNWLFKNFKLLRMLKIIVAIVTRFGNFLHFGQLFKAFGTN